MMKREDKNKLIEKLTEDIKKYDHFYLTDTKGLNAEDTTNLRRKCYENDVKLTVVKNRLFKLALDNFDGEFDEFLEILKNNTSVMFTNTANAPGKIIKDFLKDHSKPVLKGAYAAESVYIGEENLDALAGLKSKEELLGDIVNILQSPAKTVISQLQSGSQTIAGVVKTLSEKEEK